MIDTQIHVAIRSYKRAGRVKTLTVAPFAHVWVPESQADDYRQHYGDRVISIPDACDGNLCRKSNAILDRSPCPWTLILDDDIPVIGMIEGGRRSRLSPEHFAEMIEHYFDVAAQLGVKLWGINQNQDDMGYKTCTPLALLAPILGPFNGHLQPSLRYDETVLGKDDYDFWLQNIRAYHKTLRVNKYHYIHDHGKGSGGFVAQRSRAVEVAGIKRMQEKWGNRVFRVGGSAGAGRDRRVNPMGNILNSLITVPLSGC